MQGIGPDVGFGSQICETTFAGGRHIVVFSAARQRRDIARRLQLIVKVETKLLALENRGRRGDFVAATDFAAAAATIVARSPVKVLFDISDVADGRFGYDYNRDALDCDEALAGHYAFATSLDPRVAHAAEVLAAHQSL